MLIISLMTFLLAGTELLQGPGTVPVKIGNAISLQLPASLSLQSAAEINQRYVAARPPLALYSDASGQVDLSVNKAVTRWGEDDYEIMKSFYKSTIMGLYSEVQFITEEIRQIDGRKFVAFEFIGRVIPGEGTTQSESAEVRYSQILYTIAGDQTVLFNFSCAGRLQDQWSSRASAIMKSIRIAGQP
jgi:hypothetical protein